MRPSTKRQSKVFKLWCLNTSLSNIKILKFFSLYYLRGEFCVNYLSTPSVYSPPDMLIFDYCATIFSWRLTVTF